MKLQEYSDFYREIYDYMIKNNKDLNSEFINDINLINIIFDKYISNEIAQNSLLVNNKVKSIINLNNSILSDCVFKNFNNGYLKSEIKLTRYIQHKYSSKDGCHYFKYVNNIYFTNDLINWYESDNNNIKFYHENDVNINYYEDTQNLCLYLTNNNYIINNLKKLFIDGITKDYVSKTQYCNLLKIILDYYENLENRSRHKEDLKYSSDIYFINELFNHYLGLRHNLVLVYGLKIPKISNKVLLVRYNYSNGYEEPDKYNNVSHKDTLLILNEEQ